MLRSMFLMMAAALLLMPLTPVAANAQIVPAPTAASSAPMVAPADPYTITGVAIDIPVPNAQTARDTALLAAERQALQRLKEQLTVSGGSGDAIGEPSDTQLARMVQNFEVAGERLSARRYTGVFTIKFRPSAVGHAASVAATDAVAPPAAAQATATLSATYRLTSLSQWTGVQQRLRIAGPVRSADLTVIGRGYLQLQLAYTGSEDALNHALEAQGLQLQPNGSGFNLVDLQG